jgi:hypothetical protein
MNMQHSVFALSLAGVLACSSNNLPGSSTSADSGPTTATEGGAAGDGSGGPDGATGDGSLSDVSYGDAGPGGTPWSGIVATTRAIDWSKAGVPGGIPNRTQQCGATVAAYSGTADAINAAISACGDNQYVLLGAGTFNLTTGITFNAKSNVTLRGAGADKTSLAFTAANACGGIPGDICVWNADGNYSRGVENTANWTAGYAQGATAITLDTTTNLSVGGLIMLDQLADATDDGTIYQAIVQGLNCVKCNQPGRLGRPQTQIVKVTAIAGNQVTITPGLYMPNWRAGQKPGAWWGTTLPIVGDGVEDLSIDSGGVQTGGGVIAFINGYGNWVKGVRTLDAADHHVIFWQSAHNTVQSSYFYGSQGHDGTFSQSYGTGGYLSSDELVENNIFQHVGSPLMNEADQGEVYGYNYAIDDFNGSEPSWPLPSSDHHAPGDTYILWEGNNGFDLMEDNIHGPADFITAFRNRWSGWQAGIVFQSVPFMDYSFSRYTNLVGNVLGTAGYHTHYTSVAGDGTGTGPATGLCNHSIYALGWGGNCEDWTSGACGETNCPVSDPHVASTLLRWGNYDTVSGAPQWTASEVPSGLASYANAVPANHGLPASFYLAGKPSFWGSMPFPAVGPDVAGGDVPGVGGHAYLIPAARCYLTVMGGQTDGTSGALSFSASSCYP